MFHQPQYFRHYSVTQRIAPQAQSRRRKFMGDAQKDFSSPFAHSLQIFRNGARKSGRCVAEKEEEEGAGIYTISHI
jgi:hypothetical protein